MHSIRTKITVMTATMVIIVMAFAAIFGVLAIRNIGIQNANQTLMLLCEAGQKNLNTYLMEVEQSVEMVHAYVEEDLDGIDDERLQAHLDRVSNIFKKLSFETNGVITYYYRIDPEVNPNVQGFWYVNEDGNGFKEHQVTDITLYDTSDTSQLVWFTVPKYTGEPVWLPPYITDNLDVRVISYNVPVYLDGQFIGVIGIELDYKTMAEQVDNITLYENGYAFINDAEGNIIYHPHIDITEADQPIVPEGLLSSNSIVRYNFNGVDKIAVWLPLSNGAHINVCVPVDEINQGWHTWILIILIVFAILLVIFILITRFTAGRITKPLMELTNAAEQVDAGNYNFTLDYNEDDEVGKLTKTFNLLTAHLKTTIKGLNNLAYRDALTSLRNKGAYDIYVNNMQVNLEQSKTLKEFAICIFDCNHLKEVNDNFGHDKGDIYLKKSAEVICNVFAHSPVFRIGGDEFAAILMNQDYQNREQLVADFEKACQKTRESEPDQWNQADVAWGIAVYNPEEHDSVNVVTRLADRAMYKNKWKCRNASQNTE